VSQNNELDESKLFADIKMWHKYLLIFKYFYFLFPKNRRYFYQINPFSMQKKSLLFALTFVALTIVIGGCSKDSNDAPAPKTKTELLTTGTWKYEKIDPALAESYITCFKDNIITFTADGKGTCPDTGVQCNPVTGNFNWNFTDSETKIHLDATLIPAGSQDFTIVTLTETTLALSQTITSPVTATITITFKH
jgi:hypothetical protein